MAGTPVRLHGMSSGLLTGSASLPHLPGRPSLTEKLATLSSGLSDHRAPKMRQRVFAAHAHDAQQLQQMVALLTSRSGKPPGRDRGISNAGLIEEGQLYAVCMQEVAAQMAVHSPALSEMSGQLFHGFVALFQKAVNHQETRLSREREAHEATRVQLREAEAETAHWRTQRDEMEHIQSVPLPALYVR